MARCFITKIFDKVCLLVHFQKDGFHDMPNTTKRPFIGICYVALSDSVYCKLQTHMYTLTCMYCVCACVFQFSCACTCVYVCLFLKCLCVCLCFAYILVDLYICVCVCLYMYVFVYVCACICMCSYMCVHVYVCVFICVCLYMYVLVYVCACIHVCDTCGKLPSLRDTSARRDANLANFNVSARTYKSPHKDLKYQKWYLARRPIPAISVKPMF